MMKKMSRVLTCMILALTVVFVLLFTGCQPGDSESTPSSSDKSDVSTPSSETPSTPESETPSEPESGTPSGENLLANALGRQ